MIRTKNFYGLLLFVFVLLIALLIVLPEGGENSKKSIQGDAIFGISQDTYSVAHHTPAIVHDRQGFIERVKEALKSYPIVENVVSEAVIGVYTEEDVTKKVDNSISVVPRIGSLFACAGQNSTQRLPVPFDIPSTPILASVPSCVSKTGAIGILNSGALLYSAVTEDTYESTKDICGKHRDADGIFHYHKESKCMEKGSDGNIGYALDGFKIFPSFEEGSVITNRHLDVCHGHTHTILVKGVLDEMYHYHMTEEYPYSVGCYMGTRNQVQ